MSMFFLCWHSKNVSTMLNREFQDRWKKGENVQTLTRRFWTQVMALNYIRNWTYKITYDSIDSTSSKCFYYFLGVAQKFYYIIAIEVNYYKGSAICRENGGRAALIRTQEEWDRAITLVDNPFNVDVFLGFREESGGDFIERLLFHQLNDGEQNTENHQCVKYSLRHLHWSYADCNDKLQILCEGLYCSCYFV